MIHIGCDVHKKKTTIAVIDDETGEVFKPYTVETMQLRAELDKYLGGSRIALETSTVGMFVARDLISCGHDVWAVDAFKASMLLEVIFRAKTDKLDAMGLGHLLSKGMLDEARVWVPGDEHLQLRELCRTRYSFVGRSTAMRNQIRKFLSRYGHDCPHSDLAGKKAQKWLAELLGDLSPALAICLREMLDDLAHLVAAIQRLSDEIEQLTEDNEDVQLLKTIPGIGTTLASIIASEIGDIARFPSAGNLRSYARLTPKVRQSADRTQTGPLNKFGNRLLSWAFIQAAGHFVSNKRLRETMTCKRYHRVCRKFSSNPARVNVARELATIVFAMLRDREPFDVSRLTPAQAA